MRLVNTTTHDIELNLLQGGPVVDTPVRVVVPASSFLSGLPDYVNLIQQSASAIAFFTTGQLQIKNDNNTAWSGEAIGTTVNPMPFRRYRRYDGAIIFVVDTTYTDVPDLSEVSHNDFPIAVYIVVGDQTFLSSDIYLPGQGSEWLVSGSPVSFPGQVVHLHNLCSEASPIGIGGDGNTGSALSENQGCAYVSQLYNQNSSATSGSLVWSQIGVPYGLSQ